MIQYKQMIRVIYIVICRTLLKFPIYTKNNGIIFIIASTNGITREIVFLCI